ncbi:hypothetical protein [Luteolibacter luteus]|uniref:Phage tail protein n=1 Tax=Luteolibacter luteus TaxID=2728835 RepID=A0A858RGY0_9BACT|nr:hypothetical protein [Luteolibacter luteus]QJE95955.1 hypothetical protein HHL09_09230 [Luteolibacter luteus]
MKDIIIGSHLLFCRAGTVIGGIPTGPEAMPDTSPGNYIKFPSITDWAPKVTRNIVKRRAPAPGKFQNRKSIILSTEVTHAFSLQEFTETTLAELVLGGEKPVGGVFVPGSASELLTGWWIVQGYDQTDQEIVALNVWAEASCEGYTFKEGLDPYAIVLTQLISTLNTGEVSNLT